MLIDEQAIATQYLPLARKVAVSLAAKSQSHRLSRDDAEAEAGYALLIAMRKFDAGRGVPFEKYLGVILKHRIIDLLRQTGCCDRQRRSRYPWPVAGDHDLQLRFDSLAAPGGESDLEEREWLSRLRRGLTWTERIVLVLQYEEGLSQVEISRCLNCSAARISLLRAAAIDFLRTKLTLLCNEANR